MKELSEKASVSEVGQHLPIAQEILNGVEAPQIVAFLLKSYFSNQADDGRRATMQASAPVAAQPAPRGHHASSEPRAEGEGQARRRRRRRGGAGRSAEGTRPIGGMETVDASELLAGDARRAAPKAAHQEPRPAAPSDGLTRIRVNIGFDDGFKGRGAVAKKISALAGLNEGIITEVESRRDHAVLKATPEIASLVMERVDGAQVGKKVIEVSVGS